MSIDVLFFNTTRAGMDVAVNSSGHPVVSGMFSTAVSGGASRSVTASGTLEYVAYARIRNGNPGWVLTTPKFSGDVEVTLALFDLPPRG
jgi:hypothetical protein